MKKFFLLLLFTVAPQLLPAHEHLDVRRSASTPGALAFITTPANTSLPATYFPLHEAPSSSLPAFPGGAYAAELTFSAFESTTPPSPAALVRVQVLAVSGPAGGSFSFWEKGASGPTWTRAAGWTASGADQVSFLISEDANSDGVPDDGAGFGHLHGRVFTMNQPGVYDVTFRAVDAKAANPYAPSAPVTIRFTALNPPQLAVSKVGDAIKLTFTGRANLSYDVQSSTTLNADDWTTLTTLGEETASLLECTDAIDGRPRVFYRLVEYP